MCGPETGGRGRGMNVTVTGSSGFIGTYLVEALRAGGHRVTGVDRDAPAWSAPDRMVRGDLMEEAVRDEAVRGADAVFHLAAAKDDWGVSEEEYYRDNLEVTERLLKTGERHGVGDWLFYSTVGVLGPSERPLDEDAPHAPTTPYAASKAEAEERFRALAERRPEARVVVLRPSAVFGPENPPTTNVYRLIEAIRRRRFLMVGDGAERKTTSFIGNLLPATLFLWSRTGPGLHLYHYVDQPVLRTFDLVGRLHRELDRRPPRLRLPLWLARPLASVSDVAAAALGVDLPITAARIEKFCTATNFDASAIRGMGFEPPVGHDEALRWTVEWHLTRDPDHARTLSHAVLPA